MKPPYRPAGTSLNPLHVAEGCQPFFRGRPVGSFRGLNPLHVAEGCQPKRCASISVGNWVSIRCMSRKAVSQVTLALGEATGVSIRCMSRKAVSLLRRNAFVKRHLQAEFPARLTDFWRENRTDHESSGRLFAFQP